MFIQIKDSLGYASQIKNLTDSIYIYANNGEGQLDGTYSQ
jgi:hypothetical protein